MSALRGFRKVVACMGKRSRNEVNLKNAHVPRLVRGIRNIRHPTDKPWDAGNENWP
ncbi:hypothetical protein [Legionella fairfieldensis]|uniref:hypothetical protein n=1 Tax=Legionella fairfieldensis TaxID=45064 RepID=UPI0012EB479B|nr:hypothetical protein [Legionella fairfieldensis]